MSVIIEYMSHTIAVDIGSTHIRVAHQRTRSRASQPGVYERFTRAIESIAFHPRFLDHLVIPKAALGDDAGRLGTLALARMESV